jgi:hypothetical protein
MSRSVYVFGGLLALSLGAAWARYTSDEAAPKEGVLLVEGKKEQLERIVYDGPDSDVTYELRKDDFGAYAWVTVVETKKKGDVEETKTSRFKAGKDGDKLVEGLSPMMALRELKDVDSTKLAQFGLESPTTTLTLSVAGRETRLALGGETYGSKDIYVQDTATKRIFVMDDELVKPLRFANTRLPDRALSSTKIEDITGVTLSKEAASVGWTQQNRDDRAAAYWKRDGGDAGKDETFGNWYDKFSKVKSVNYVQDGEAPADLLNAFAVTIRAESGPAETVQFLTAGEEWFARSEGTRGLVKLPRGSAKDAADDVQDVLDGKAPPEDAPPAAPAGAGGIPPKVELGATPGVPGAPASSALPTPDLGPLAPKGK